jgi:hypothetical protein
LKWAREKRRWEWVNCRRRIAVSGYEAGEEVEVGWKGLEAGGVGSYINYKQR